MCSARAQNILLTLLAYSIESASETWSFGIEQDSRLVNTLALRVLPTQ